MSALKNLNEERQGPQRGPRPIQNLSKCLWNLIFVLSENTPEGFSLSCLLQKIFI